jgi:hypothetical protein
MATSKLPCRVYFGGKRLISRRPLRYFWALLSFLWDFSAKVQRSLLNASTNSVKNTEGPTLAYART